MLGSCINRTAKSAVEALRKHGYRCRRNAGKAAAMDAVGRYERGLLSYLRCDMEELRTFCKARNIKSKARSVQGVVEVLEQADDSAVFPRFLDLPPEIRNAIYEFHFRDFHGMAAKHVQPPLTLASSQLRLEALPLFYKCVTFAWSIDIYQPWLDEDDLVDFYADIDGFIERDEFDTCFKRDSVDLTRMPAANLSRIETTMLRWAVKEVDGYNVERKVFLTVKLAQHKHRAAGNTIRCSKSTSSGKRLYRAVRSALVEIGYYDDGWKLKAEHLHALEAAVHDLVNGSWVYKL